MKRVLILTANAALVILCCVLLAWGIINPVIDAVLAPDVVEADPGAASAEASPRDRADRQIVLTRNLFNVSTLSPDPTATEEDEYEKTKLPLRLLGTAAAADRALSWAAIEDLETKQHLVVRLEQEIKGGARVLKIERRRIVLQNGGRREELALEGDSGAPAPGPAPTSAQRARPQARGNLERLAQNRFAVDKSEVQNLATNPSALFSQARILPKYEGGQMVGVQVSAIKPGSLFEQAGLQNGDTITEINGQPVSGPEGAPQLFQKLTQGGDIRLGVQGENGTRRDIDFSQR
jgi:general secretion pathway protein C